jgi:hypothetical protein
MSAPAVHLITIDAGVFLDLSIVHGLTAEQTGAAVTVFAWRARGNEGNDDTLRRVAGLSKRRWAKECACILLGARALIDASEHRVRRGRPVVPAARRALILVRDGRLCRYCGATDGPFHIDHVVPVSRGGSNNDDNLCVACAPCNLRKSAKVGREWVR